MNKIDMKKIFDAFDIEFNVLPYGNGNINDTYCSNPTQYIIQRINTNIFTNPDELMENIENVTSFLKAKISAQGGDPDRETLTVVKTVDGKNCFKYDENNVYRVYTFIGNAKTVETDKTIEDLYNAGKGFGKFQQMLSDFPVEKLHETIKDFHNTPKRVEALKTAISEDKAGRAALVKDEIDFALKNAEFASTVVDLMAEGKVPSRVTHNDTKINNILFDEKTGKAVAVIDLDTVMLGSMLYDFGDALRMGASTAAEDETDIDKIHVDRECFECFTKGYLEETKDVLTPMEIELLPFSMKLLTFECGIRFLTDYLNGDTYFKIHRENHNLDRARNQFKLVAELNEIENELKETVKSLL